MSEEKKITHYSRTGYNGNYTYTVVCGKKVKTHQNNEDSDIDPEKANCPKCLATKEYKTDLGDQKKTKRGIKRRIYIESDILQAGELSNVQRKVYDFAKENNLKCVDRVFSHILDRAWHDLEKTWDAVKMADEIYADSSLMPLCGGSYMGAPVIFNGMCERAIKEGVTGKSVIILNELKNISWHMIKIDIMKKAFKVNDLFMYNENYDLVKIDVQKIKDK